MNEPKPNHEPQSPNWPPSPYVPDKPSSRNSKPKDRRGALWIVLVILGIISAIVGISVGSNSVARGCGSVFNQKNLGAEVADTLQGVYGNVAKCNAKIDAATIPTWFFLIIGILLVVVGCVIRYMPARQTVVVSPPLMEGKSIAGKLRELEGLRESGLVTEQEYSTKRKDLLERM